MWRREWDSNPRTLARRRFSRPVPSTARTSPGGGQQPPHWDSAPPPRPDPPPSGENGPDSLSSLLRHLLDQFHLSSVDSGDLLLLAILFFLFREGADEELLVALGLLLIL